MSWNLKREMKKVCLCWTELGYITCHSPSIVLPHWFKCFHPGSWHGSFQTHSIPIRSQKTPFLKNLASVHLNEFETTRNKYFTYYTIKFQIKLNNFTILHSLLSNIIHWPIFNLILQLYINITSQTRTKQIVQLCNFILLKKIQNMHIEFRMASNQRHT